MWQQECHILAILRCNWMVTFQLKFRHGHSFNKKHKMSLLDLWLDYKAIKVIGDLHFKCIIYCWVLSIVLLDLIMVVSHCFWSQKLCERHGHIMILCKDQIIKHVSCRQHHACTSVFTLLALWPFMWVHVSWTLTLIKSKFFSEFVSTDKPTN